MLGASAMGQMPDRLDSIALLSDRVLNVRARTDSCSGAYYAHRRPPRCGQLQFPRGLPHPTEGPSEGARAKLTRRNHCTKAAMSSHSGALIPPCEVRWTYRRPAARHTDEIAVYFATFSWPSMFEAFESLGASAIITDLTDFLPGHQL